LHGTDPPIKSLNRDGQQFHQKYISPQIIEQKKTTTYEVVNPGPGLGQAPKCATMYPNQKTLSTQPSKNNNNIRPTKTKQLVIAFNSYLYNDFASVTWIF